MGTLLDSEYTVTFIGDYFSLTVNVQGVEAENSDDEGDVAIDLAANIIKSHYGWDIKQVSNDIEYWKQEFD